MAVLQKQKKPDKGMVKLLQPFTTTTSAAGNRSTTKGCTKKRKFLLEMTRDVIARSREQIKAGVGNSVSPKRGSKRKASDTPPGCPRTHKWEREFSEVSRYCQVCYQKAVLINQQQPVERRLKRTQILKGQLGPVHYCRSGC